jgi:hypothetical protein
MIFTKKIRSYYYHKFGKNLVCLSQMYNHIPGGGTLKRKDLNVESVKLNFMFSLYFKKIK